MKLDNIEEDLKKENFRLLPRFYWRSREFNESYYDPDNPWKRDGWKREVFGSFQVWRPEELDSWFFIETENNGKPLKPYFDSMVEKTKWILCSTEGRWFMSPGGYWFWFEELSDAVLFKFAWGVNDDL